MNAEYCIVDDNTESQEVEHVREILPYDWRPIFPYAFRVKSVSLEFKRKVAKGQPLEHSCQFPVGPSARKSRLSP
jgi:hypothetical protein